MFSSRTGNEEIVSDSRKRPRHDLRAMKYTLPKASFRENFYKEEIEILDMIRDRSCRSKFKDLCRNRLENHGKTEDALFHHWWRPKSNSGLVSHRLLFQKELTPSDVGKLNRLVIPKKHAVEHFPSIREAGDASGDRRNYVDDTELVFHDRLMKVWKFRYCYWKSSQSFVFTRGWNRFVQERELRAKDVVAFYTCEYTNHTEEEAGTFLMIDVSYVDGRCDDNEESKHLKNREGLDLQLGKRGSFRGYGSEEEEEGEEEEHKEEENGVRLFGVQIN